MKFNRMFSKLYVGLAMLCGLSFASCEAGLTYEEAPESVYSEVNVAGTPFYVKARQLFPDQVWAVNYNQYSTNYMNTQQISWETELTEENDATAPDGILYVINVKANTKVVYSTPNKGFLFDASKMSGDFELLDYDDATKSYVPAADTKARYVRMKVNPQEVIGELVLVNPYDNEVERVDDASKLGVPADFSKANRYLVKNICYRPAGVKQVTRLYEVRVTFQDKE